MIACALTGSDSDPIFIESYFPGDERFLFTRDEGGDELDHLFVRELDGTVRDLTPGEGFKASFEGWTQDDQHFVVATTERDERFFDVYLYSRDGYDREMIYQNNEGYDFEAIEAKACSPNGSGLYYLTDKDSEYKYLAHYDLESGRSDIVVQPEWDVWYATPSKSGKYLVVGINNDARTEVRIYDAASMKPLDQGGAGFRGCG